jgi:hypothetical protein
MLIRLPDAPPEPRGTVRARGGSPAYPVLSPRNPGSFQGWGPKL